MRLPVMVPCRVDNVQFPGQKTLCLGRLATPHPAHLFSLCAGLKCRAARVDGVGRFFEVNRRGSDPPEPSGTAVRELKNVDFGR